MAKAKKKKVITRCSGLNAHIMVAEVAIGMANELFEMYARDNAIYKRLRADGQVTEEQARDFFIRRTTQSLFEQARQALTDRLSAPDDEVTPYMKAEIAEALILDNDLRANRRVADNVIEQHVMTMH